MTVWTRWWLVILALGLVLIYVLSGVLAPFIAGMATAYFLDPVAGRLERLGLSRAMATLLITAVFFTLVGVTIVLLAPLIEAQLAAFIAHIPDYKKSVEARFGPVIKTLLSHISRHDVERLRGALGDQAGAVASWAFGFLQTVLGGVLKGGMALVNLASLLFITPIATFYLLRDWPKLMTRVKAWLPRKRAALIIDCALQIDATLAAFVRGQALVCLALAILYGVGLTLVGIDLGLVIGIAAGVLSFVPYLGTLSGLCVAVGVGFAQGGDWHLPTAAAAVFVVGNLLEGNFLTPKLVGDRVGLHPLWIMFALLAGGAGFGFVGVLLAVPVAAVTGVVVRTLLTGYLSSPLYLGTEDR